MGALVVFPARPCALMALGAGERRPGATPGTAAPGRAAGALPGAAAAPHSVPTAAPGVGR